MTIYQLTAMFSGTTVGAKPAVILGIAAGALIIIYIAGRLLIRLVGTEWFGGG